MSRIAKLPVDQWDAELRAVTQAERVTPLEQGIMRMLAHIPEIAKGFARFAGAAKTHRRLPERLAELVRLRIAFHNQCRSCMAIRYREAMADGVDEDLVCSLEWPADAPDLTPSEKAAIAYADLLATDHLAINDATYDGLRKYFTEAEIVELGVWAATCLGFGRLTATWHMVEELPDSFQGDQAEKLAPWRSDWIDVGSDGTAALEIVDAEANSH